DASAKRNAADSTAAEAAPKNASPCQKSVAQPPEAVGACVEATSAAATTWPLSSVIGYAPRAAGPPAPPAATSRAESRPPDSAASTTGCHSARSLGENAAPAGSELPSRRPSDP